MFHGSIRAPNLTKSLLFVLLAIHCSDDRRIAAEPQLRAEVRLAALPLENPLGEGLLPDGVIARLGTRRYRGSSPIANFAVSPGSELLAIEDEAGRITLLDTTTGSRARQPAIPSTGKLPAFSPGGRCFACVVEGRGREWLIATGEENLLRHPSPDGDLKSLTYTRSNVLLGVVTTPGSTLVRIINLHDGTELGRLPENPTPQLSPDGMRALTPFSESRRHTATLWDVETRNQVSSIKAPGVEPPLVAFIATGTPIAISCHDNNRSTLSDSSSNNWLSVLDVATGKTIREFAEKHEVRCLGISPESDLIAMHTLGETLPKIYIVDDDDAPGKATTGALQVTPTENPAASPAILSVRKMTTGEEVFQAQIPRHSPQQARFSANGRIMAVVSKNDFDERSHALSVWDLTAKKRLDSDYPGHTNAVQSVAFGPNGKLLASTSRDGTVRLWDISNAREIAVIDDDEFNGRSVDISPDGELVAATAGGFYRGGSRVDVWNIQAAKPAHTLPVAYISDAASVAFSRDGKYFATGARLPRGGWLIMGLDKARTRGGIEAWDREDLARFPFDNRPDKRYRKTAVPAEKFHARGAMSDFMDGTSCVAFSRDTTMLAAVGTDPIGEGKLSLWKIPSGDLIHRIERPDWYVGSVVFSPDGKLIATTSSRIIDESRSFEPQIKDDSMFNDSRRRQIELWNVQDGAVAKTLQGHHGDVGGIAFSPDGRFLASASLDKTVGVWSVISGQLITRLKGHDGGVLCVAFSPDGKLLASGSADTTVMIWDMTSAVVQKLGPTDKFR